MPDTPSIFDPNPFNPTQAGLSAARQGGLDSLGRNAWLTAAGGAGLGYAFGGKKHRLRNAFLGGLGGLAAGVGVQSGVAGMAARTESQNQRSALARTLQDQMAAQSPRWESKEYLQDLMLTKPPQVEGLRDLDPEQRKLFDQTQESVRGWRPFWSQQGGSPSASAHAALARQSYIEDALTAGGLPMSKFQDPKFDQDAFLQQLLKKHAPDLESEWASKNITEAMLRNFRR